jgi:glycosyltransferase involved in cell wall biosynthesis
MHHKAGASGGFCVRSLLIDPSLFTAPYDAALSAGLRSNGITPQWAVRPLRRGEEAELLLSETITHFYRQTDGPHRAAGRLAKFAKGIEHAVDMARLQSLARVISPDIVHIQWSTMPLIDIPALGMLRRQRPIVLTVHDTTAFNGARISRLQIMGFDRLFGAVDRLIVHTEGAAATLEARGVEGSRIAVIPHGPLAMRCAPRPVARDAAKWRIVLVGRLQSYKGVDVLVEALGLLNIATRNRIEVIVAGEPMIDMRPILDRASALNLGNDVLRFRLERLSEQDMADLMGSADGFVFPYRSIEASGVYYLVAQLRKWIIASELGAFREGLDANDRGVLVPPEDPSALAAAIRDSIGRTVDIVTASTMPNWEDIGALTRTAYEQAIANWPHRGIAA